MPPSEHILVNHHPPLVCLEAPLIQQRILVCPCQEYVFIKLFYHITVFYTYCHFQCRISFFNFISRTRKLMNEFAMLLTTTRFFRCTEFGDTERGGGGSDMHIHGNL